MAKRKVNIVRRLLECFIVAYVTSDGANSRLWWFSAMNQSLSDVIDLVDCLKENTNTMTYLCDG